MVPRMKSACAIRLTLGTYTDPRLLDEAAAPDALPKMTPEPKRATGKFGVLLGGKTRPTMHNRSQVCSGAAVKRGTREPSQVVMSTQVSSAVHRSSVKRARRFELPTSSLGSRKQPMIIPPNKAENAYVERT